MQVNLVQFCFNVKADVCLTFVPIHIMLQQGNDVLTVDHSAVPMELVLKVARPITYILTRTLSVAHEHNQPNICLFHHKAIENMRNSYL